MKYLFKRLVVFCLLFSFFSGSAWAGKKRPRSASGHSSSELDTSAAAHPTLGGAGARGSSDEALTQPPAVKRPALAPFLDDHGFDADDEGEGDEYFDLIYFLKKSKEAGCAKKVAKGKENISPFFNKKGKAKGSHHPGRKPLGALHASSSAGSSWGGSSAFKSGFDDLLGAEHEESASFMPRGGAGYKPRGEEHEKSAAPAKPVGAHLFSASKPFLSAAAAVPACHKEASSPPHSMALSVLAGGHGAEAAVLELAPAHLPLGLAPAHLEDGAALAPTHVDSSAASASGGHAAAPVAPPALAPVRPLIEIPTYPTRSRVFAIGDLHGSLDATLATLRMAGAIDDSRNWIGHQITVVITGDFLDRGVHDWEVYELLKKWEAEASAHESQLIILNGNHEFMNIVGDLYQVHPDSLKPYEDHFARTKDSYQTRYQLTAEQAVERIQQGVKWFESWLIGGLEMFPESIAVVKESRLQLKPGLLHRALMFQRGSLFSWELSHRHAFVRVGDSIFAHAGITPAHLAAGLMQFEEKAITWMRDPQSDVPPFLDPFHEDWQNSPWWTRSYQDLPNDGTPEAVLLTPAHQAVCDGLNEVLAALGAKRMVIGHNPQATGKIGTICQGKLWRIDVALSEAFWPVDPTHGQKRMMPYEILQIDPVAPGRSEEILTPLIQGGP